MSNDDNQSRARDVRDRIASFMQADEHARRKPVTEADVQTLRAAAERLDQLLADVAKDEQVPSKQFTDEDLHKFRAAAGRLDQLLARVAGKEVVTEWKQRSRKKNTIE